MKLNGNCNQTLRIQPEGVLRGDAGRRAHRAGLFRRLISLGIAARSAGLTPIQGFIASLFNNASAGEYAAFSLIAAGATYVEVAIITLIANARYLLMSCALAQRFAPGTPFSIGSSSATMSPMSCLASPSPGRAA